MSYQTTHFGRSRQEAPRGGLDELRHFVAAHAEGLRHAAGLLGGTRHTRAVDELLDRLTTEPSLGRRTRQILDDLLGLLSLELVDDLESPEAQAFSLVPPDHPAVAEICLLVDSLRYALAAAQHEMRPATSRLFLRSV